MNELEEDFNILIRVWLKNNNRDIAKLSHSLARHAKTVLNRPSKIGICVKFIEGNEFNSDYCTNCGNHKKEH